MIGFIRCVGDGEHIVYVQDLIVDVEYKRRGIGRELMDKVMNKFINVHMLTLITDSADEISNSFYNAMENVKQAKASLKTAPITEIRLNAGVFCCWPESVWICNARTH